MTNWGKFNNINAKELNDEVNDLKGDGDFPEIPCGKYEVALDSMELKPTKDKGYPMISAKFTILEGQYENQKIFVNLVVLRGTANDKYSLRTANEFLKSFKTQVPVVFEGVPEYEALVDKIAHEVNKIGYEYLLEISDSKPGKDGRVFKNYKIVKVYETE